MRRWRNYPPSQDATSRLQASDYLGVRHEISRLVVDFDTEKDVMKSFNVSYRSTFVVFKGPNEVGRSTGDTQQDSIAALFLKAL